MNVRRACKVHVAVRKPFPTAMQRCTVFSLERLTEVQMSPVVTTQPTLTDAEWALVVELLERERSHLPIEIHHTTTRSFKEQLRRRLKLVETLLTRLHPPTQ